MEKSKRDYLDEVVDLSCRRDEEFRADWAARQLVLELAQRRAELGLTQQEVADRMGVSRPRVAEIENGGTNASFQRIAAYANALGMRLEANRVAEPRVEYGTQSQKRRTKPRK
jgi:transcriptional regulator with XRE-family HTH domain